MSTPPEGGSPPAPWHTLREDPGPDLRLFRVRHDLVESPRTGVQFPALVLETPDWVNVVAVTAERELVMVTQYRFGTRELSLEIPGGLIDPGEEPLAAARRELREETGFVSEDWQYLGCVEPNPAFHTNRCHHYLARNAVSAGALQQEITEDIQVTCHPLGQVRDLVQRGEIRNSLVVVALARVLDLRDPTAEGATDAPA